MIHWPPGIYSGNIRKQQNGGWGGGGGNRHWLEVGLIGSAPWTTPDTHAQLGLNLLTHTHMNWLFMTSKPNSCCYKVRQVGELLQSGATFSFKGKNREFATCWSQECILPFLLFFSSWERGDLWLSFVDTMRRGVALHRGPSHAPPIDAAPSLIAGFSNWGNVSIG